MKLTVIYPSKKEEITVEQYQKYLFLFEENKDYDIKQEDLFNIFTNVSPSKLPALKVDEICVKIVKALNDLEDVKGLETIIGVEGKDFGFIPNLNKMSFGEYEDLIDTLQSSKTLHNALEILYRPIDKRTKDIYSIESYRGYGDRGGLFKKLPAVILKGSLVFFYHLIRDLEIYTRNSLSNKAKKKPKSLAAAV